VDLLDKTVRVLLLAEVSRYKAGLRDAAASTAAFGNEVEQHLGAMSGQRLSQVGGQLTRSVTLPIVAAGAAAGALAVRFDDAFRQMQGLAGVTAEEVDGLRDSVLDLAGETAQSPQELAEALYFIRSAGIDGAAALDALEWSAKGATIGLGEASSVADLLTSAMGAYGTETLSAAEATDVLVATAREGKAEASALAPQMGRLLPIASELGVSFAEVGGALAFLSRSGGGAELASTNLGNVLQKLLTPAEEGVRALEAMGMSTEDLKASIAERGLLGTLVFLRESLEANGMSMSDFSRDAQFTTGVLALTRDGGVEAAAAMDAVAASTGDAREAFQVAASGPGFEMRQSLAQIQVAAIGLGDTLIPIASDILGIVATLADAFGDLPGPVQTGITVLLGIAAAAGPITSVVGKVKELQEKLNGLGPSGQRVSAGLSALGPVAAGAALASAAWFAYADSQREAEARVNSLTEALEDQNAPISENITRAFSERLSDGMVEGLNAIGVSAREAEEAITGTGSAATLLEVALKNAGYDDAGAEVLQLRQDFEQAAAAMINTAIAEERFSAASLEAELRAAGLDTTASKLADALADGTVSADELVGAGLNLAPVFELLGIEAPVAADAIGELPGALDPATQSAEDAEQALKDYLDTLRGAIDPLFGMLTALDGNREAQAALDEAIQSGTASAAELDRAHQEVAESALGVEEAAVGLTAAMANGSVTTEGAAAMLQAWVTQGLITQGTADVLAQRIGLVALAADEFDGTYTATVVADTAQAHKALSDLQYHLAAVRNSTGLIINVPGVGTRLAGASGGFVGQTVGGPTDTIPMMVAPGEFIINAGAAAALGPQMLFALNEGKVPALAGVSAGPQAVGDGGGMTHVSYVTQVIVEGQVWAMRDLAHAVGDELDRVASRRGR
jgi:TP901 family phage tail tape measure protein